MKRIGILPLALATMAAVNLAIPLHVWAENGTTSGPRGAGIVDVELGDGGSLVGQALDQNGTPQAMQPLVVVSGQGEVVARTSTDGEGAFRVNGLRGGVYQVATADSMQLCRCWAARTAPPAAQQSVLLTAGQNAQRGQMPAGKFFTHPIVLGLIIAAAIAIPIAVHNANDDAS